MQYHRPSIGGGLRNGCAFPQSVAELSFAKGQHLFHQGDPVRGAFSLTSGLIAVERVDEDGDVVILKILHEGAFFPCADLFADGVHANGARAVTPAMVCFVPSERLDAALADPSVGRAILRRGAEEARENEEIIFRLCASDLGERLLAVLEALAGDDGRTVTLPIAWRELASMIGTSPEVMSRLLKRLSEAGKLSVAGRVVTLQPDHGEDRSAAV